MRDFKRTLRNVGLFLLIILVLTMASPIYYLFFATTHLYYDVDQRDSLAGQIDTFVTGASHIMYCFDPDQYDAAMGTVSYNLAGVLMSMQGRYELLEQEFQRNPVDTLILEMSLDTLTRKESYHVEGDMTLLPRLGSAGTKIRYFFQNFRPDEYDDAWSIAFANGLGDMVYDKSLDGNRGLYPSQPAVSQALTPEQIREQYRLLPIPTDPHEKELYWMDQIFRLCEEHGVRVIMITTPLPQSTIIRYDGYDQIWQMYDAIAREHGCLYIDFNLDPASKELFPDESAFYDQFHLVNGAAAAFTDLLTETIRQYDAGIDIFADDYASYEELLEQYRLS